ncbi:MAG TPA: molybdenum cofactor biosynthesis protein MoaE [Methanofastidiosum sp.]|nr:molybdenum cofactor biosynthesis protein MoaE [Methanofastidiosum sp.]HPA49445.1 molybdenum cofactor biosynthesis protein MoaE [Methanofastidiosum sp.]HQK63410.1 molybdenum cofactor biosynthesis protein MoaE [Methanofastidiosum sp.]HQQ49406.1 molybdenum cofactor biosynthesis protein MoaE [Methanofastidiosum sp.]
MIKIQKDDFSVDVELKKIKNDECGASVIFVGTVKSPMNGKKVVKLELDAYVEMAEKRLREIEDDAKEKFSIKESTIIHRYGELFVGDNIVLIIVKSIDRTKSFEGAKYILERLKEEVPIFKKEYLEDNVLWHGGI